MTSRICLVLLCAIVYTLASSFEKVQTIGQTPPGRSRPVLLEGDGYLFLFGGQYDNDTDPNGYINYNDVHLYDISERRWTKVTPTTVSPPARVFHGGFRSGKDSFIIFGGASYDQGLGNIVFYNDFWEFNVTTSGWTQIVPSGETLPQILGLEAIPKGPNGKDVYLFGGVIIPFADQNEMYHYNVRTNHLTKLNIQGVRPAPRHHACLIDLPEFDKFIVFYGDRIVGGVETGAFEFNTNTLVYTPLTFNGAVPSPRQYFAGVSFGNTWYGYGGDLPSGIPGSSNTTGGTFLFHYPTLTWSEVQPDGTVPPSLKRHRAAPIRESKNGPVERMAIFGGFTQNLQETNNVQIFNSDLYYLRP